MICVFFLNKYSFNLHRYFQQTEHSMIGEDLCQKGSPV